MATQTIRRLLFLLVLPVMVAIPSNQDDPDWMADRVLVLKSQRKLFLIRDQRILKAIEIRLGLVPDGDKTSEGDFRTPEGSYVLDDRNLNSDYFLSIHISYPSQNDISEAHRQGASPGGNIMIHGVPNEKRHGREYYAEWDWTDGCIAVSNPDMMDIWTMTKANTPIEILP